MFLGALNWWNTQYNLINYYIEDFNNPPSDETRISHIDSSLFLVNAGMCLTILPFIGGIYLVTLVIRITWDIHYPAKLLLKSFWFWYMISFMPISVAIMVSFVYNDGYTEGKEFAGLVFIVLFLLVTFVLICYFLYKAHKM